jgi:hypothetical protein
LNIRKILGYVAGYTEEIGKETIIDMLNDVLGENEKEALNPKYKKAITGIAQVRILIN